MKFLVTTPYEYCEWQCTQLGSASARNTASVFEEVCTRSNPSRISIGDDRHVFAFLPLLWLWSMSLDNVTANSFDSWTSFPSISFWTPLTSGVPVGFSISWIFVCQFSFHVHFLTLLIYGNDSWVYSTILSMHTYLLQRLLSRRASSFVVLLALYSRFLFLMAHSWW